MTSISKLKKGTKVRLVGAGTGKHAVKGHVTKVYTKTVDVKWNRWGKGKHISPRDLKLRRK